MLFGHLPAPRRRKRDCMLGFDSVLLLVAKQCPESHHDRGHHSLGVVFLGGELASVEAAAELQEVARLLGLGPFFVHSVAIDAQLLAAIHRIVHAAVSKRLLPRDAKLPRELVLLVGWWVEISRLGEGRLPTARGIQWA